MIHGAYKKKLLAVFDVLGFSESEKNKALESFKRKLAFELLKSIEPQLPPDQQEWMRQAAPNIQEPKFKEIQQTIASMYSEEELYQRSQPIFKTMLDDYIVFMSRGLDPGVVDRLNQAASL